MWRQNEPEKARKTRQSDSFVCIFWRQSVALQLWLWKVCTGFTVKEQSVHFTILCVILEISGTKEVRDNF